MHPRTVGYWINQHFNPRFNLKIDPTGALYHHFIVRSRKIRKKK